MRATAARATARATRGIKAALVLTLTVGAFATAWEPRLLTPRLLTEPHRLLTVGGTLSSLIGVVSRVSAADVVAAGEAETGGQLDAAADVPAEPEAPVPAAPEIAYLAARSIDVPATAAHPAYRVYAPAGPDVPRRVLLALHGMDDTGPSLASTLLDRAQAQNWVVVAPTIRYGEWKEPLQLTQEELILAPQLVALLDAVAGETGVLTEGKALVFGFSRGSQAALRLATFHPERVEAVAAFSAGTYTLPQSQVRTVTGTTVRAALPYGVADLEARRGTGVNMEALRQVRVLVGVASGDTREGEVPRQWDLYLGKSRLDRARTYTTALQQLGVPARLTVVPGAVHGLTPQMPEQAIAFLALPA
ncbi:MAG: hypothetical protein AVDCRST_MAG77-1887 [uncultured Chloroflexi bacterium]|uniref:Uncharacterized protein n=1 Tax=uncultured Chloroflexota bacterium TaxID=166587 RepID=A0A6J4IAT0_9CHLR|nr:MAG: hypothetical protein AVDCRST_MAG77-1887 [uncultured Chloroflexota bacterium]